MLPLSTVLTVSVSSIPQGLGVYNLGNLLLVSTDGVPSSWGTSTYGIYVSPDQIATDFGVASETYLQASAVFSQQPNILANNGSLIIYPGQSNLKVAFDTIGTSTFPYFSGIISTTYPASGSMKALADDIQTYQDKILFLPSVTSGDIAGAFTTITAALDKNTRMIYSTGTALNSRLLAAAYASRLLSSNLSGSNTAISMQFKQLVGISSDEGITSTVLSNCNTAGADVYIDVAGVPMVYSGGANGYTDSVYNLVWLISSLKVAGFNALATVANKIPQTEDGMNLFKTALRSVLQQGVTNGYLAPGTWTSATTFGNQANFLNNILQYGFYIYSAPISKQSIAARAARQSPLVQIAAKEAGAIHSASILVYINP